MFAEKNSDEEKKKTTQPLLFPLFPKQNVQTIKGRFDMCKALDDMVRESKLEGEDCMGKLIKKLISAGRINNLAVVADNYDYRKQLMTEFGIR